jgi:hypothetical protein
MFVRSFHGIFLSMEFVFIDAATLCPENYQRKLQWRAVAGWYQRCEIRTVNPRSKKNLQILQSLQSGITSTARLGRKPTFTADREQELAEHVLRFAKLFFGLTLDRALPSYEWWFRRSQ